ncbi:hypothetical protein ACFE04_029561 [Oxalis oulophora]
MKFFSAYCVSCYRPAVEDTSPRQHRASPTRAADDPRTTTNMDGRKLIKSGSATEWRPGLSAISEDILPSPFVTDQKINSDDRSRAMGKSHSFNNAVGCSTRKNSMPTIIPVGTPSS